MEIIIFLALALFVYKVAYPLYKEKKEERELDAEKKTSAAVAAALAAAMLAGATATVPPVADMIDPPIVVAPAPVDTNTFTGKATSYGGGRPVLGYAVTSEITSARLTEHSYIVEHTKDGVWPSLPYENGRRIDGNEAIISYDRGKGEWIEFVFEYSVLGEFRRPKGWGEAPWILRGDPVGMLSTTSARSGEWDIDGQPDERTNIFWVKAE